VTEHQHRGGADSILAPLKYVIEYRRKDGIAWRAMAAFDVVGAAEWYFGMQGTDKPWEYRLVEVDTGLILGAKAEGGSP